MRALLFPGQGSQAPTMGRALAESNRHARALWQQADRVLGWSLSEICFAGSAQELKNTAVTQPAILTASIAALRALEGEARGSFDVALGHSLGEWSALVAAGALRFDDALRLVHLRGRAMQEAVDEGRGGMCAVLGIDPQSAEALCAQVAEGEVLAVANLNGGGQVVLSGHAGAIARAITCARDFGAKRAIALAVSAPFHCALMQPARERVTRALAEIEIRRPTVPVIANVSATPEQDPERLRALLAEQITSAVRWQQSVERACEMGVTEAVELGHGSVLRGLVRRIAPTVSTHSIGTPADVASFHHRQSA